MASGYLLDTCTVIAAIRAEPRAVLNRITGIAPERLFFSALVQAELLYGAEKAQRTAHAVAALRVITDGLASLPFTSDDAATYARIRAALERKGQMIGQMDCLIAAQAVTRRLVVVTDNTREFRRVPGLKCENWMR